MNNDDFDRTATYDSSEEDATGTYNSSENVSKTYAYKDLREQHFKSKTHGIGIDDSIILRDKEYIVTGIISEGTGEAVIYQVKDSGGKTFALKLYFEFANPKEEPNYETLRKIIGINDPDVLKLYDFGAKHESEKYQGKYCYEISEYARGGDLFSVEDFKAKYTPEFISEIIVPELFKGIKKLHELKIYHCDLKPSNIFYINEKQTDIVIGDYGSGKFFGVSQDSGKLNEDRAIRKTSTVKGTEFYLPPEQARGIISEKNDYYSFGMVLLHLLYPESVCDASDFTKIDKRKNESVSEHQFDSKQIIKFDEKFGRLNNLLAGLTLSFNKNRWGQAEVERWFKGENPEIKYSGVEKSGVQPAKLSRVIIETENDLIDFLETQSDWFEDLIDDDIHFKSVLFWLNNYKDSATRKTFENLVKFYQPIGREFIKEALLRYFNPARPIRIDMNTFNIFAAPNVKKEVDSFIKKLDELWKINPLEPKTKKPKPEEEKTTLRFYLFQLEFSLRQREAVGNAENKLVIGALIDKIYSIFGLCPTSFEDFKTEIFKKINQSNEESAFHTLINLFYAFDAERTFKDSKNNAIKTITELGLFYVQNESLFLDKHLFVEKDRFLEKLGETRLKQLDYNSFIFEIFKHHAEAQIEIVDLTFDSKRNYCVSYKFYKSLKNFLSKNKITNDFTSRSGTSEIYKHQRGFMKNFESEADNFIKTVSQKHTITTLTDLNILHIKQRFEDESRERYAYLWVERFLRLKPEINKTTVAKFEEEKDNAAKKLHFKSAFKVGCYAFAAFLILYPVYAFYAGWIVWDKNTRYFTFNNSARLDGVNFTKGDYFKISSENEFFICSGVDKELKCYPTQNLVDMGVNQQTIPIETVGKFDFESSAPRDVFKVSKDFSLTNKGKKLSYKTGDIVDIRIQGQSYCFNFGNKGSGCYDRDSRFKNDKGTDTGNFSNYGSAIEGYRGRNMFTFNKTVTLNGTTYPSGSSYEDAKSSSPWIYCFFSNGKKCFPTQNAIARLRQTEVPVITKLGAIDNRKSDFSIGSYFTWAFIFAGIVFVGAIPLAKIFKLFLLRGQIGTAKFNSMNASTR